MNTLHFGPSQHLELLRADTDLAVTGWDHPTIELILDGDPDQCTAEQKEGTLTVTSEAALALHIPKTTTVHIQQVSGDLLLRELDGETTVGSAHGDVSIQGGAAQLLLQEVRGGLTAKGLSGPLTAKRALSDIRLVDVLSVYLNEVHGNVHARSVAGDLELGNVSGDVAVRGVSGSFKIANGHGSLQAHDLYGGMEAGQIADDLSLKTVLSPGQVYRAHVKGEIRARFPAETSARFDLRSDSLVSAQLPTLEQQEPTRVIGQAGTGDADVILQAKGEMWVQMQGQTDDELDAWQTLDSISARIEAEIAQHLGKMSIDATTQREIDNAMRKAEQELSQVERHLEREALRAQEQVRRAQKKAAKAAKRAQERIARQSRSWGVGVNVGSGLFGPPLPRRRGMPKPARASAEEQLAILKMLQEGKISVQEAEELLKALEG